MPRFNDAASAAVVAGHRTLFIGGTAILAVGTTELTEDACQVAPWFLTVGAAMMMYLGDLLGELDRDSLDLSRSTGVERRQARADLFAKKSPSLTALALILAAGAMIAGVLL